VNDLANIDVAILCGGVMVYELGTGSAISKFSFALIGKLR